MAELIHVIYNIQHAGSGTIPPPPGLGASTKGIGNGGDGFTEYSKEEVEKMTGVPGNEKPERFGTEAIKIHGPIKEAKILSGEFASAANACKWVKYYLGAEVMGVVATAGGKTKIEGEAPPTNAEQAEKPMDTVKTTAMEITAAK